MVPGKIRDIAAQYYIQQSKQGFELKKSHWYSRIICFLTGKKWFSLSETRAWKLAVCADIISQRSFADPARAQSLQQIVSSLGSIIAKGKSETAANLIEHIARHAIPRSDEKADGRTWEVYADVVYAKIKTTTDRAVAFRILDELVCSSYSGSSKIIACLSRKSVDDPVLHLMCQIAEGGKEVMDIFRDKELSFTSEQFCDEVKEIVLQEIRDGINAIVGKFQRNEDVSADLVRFGKIVKNSENIFPGFEIELQAKLDERRGAIFAQRGSVCDFCLNIPERVQEGSLDFTQAACLLGNARHFYIQGPGVIDEALAVLFAGEVDTIIDQMFESSERGDDDHVLHLYENFLLKVMTQIPEEKMGVFFQKSKALIQGARKGKLIELAMRRVPFSRAKFRHGQEAVRRLFWGFERLAGESLNYEKDVGLYAVSELARIGAVTPILEKGKQLGLFLDKVEGLKFTYSQFDDTTFVKQAAPALVEIFTSIQKEVREAILLRLKEGGDIRYIIEQFYSVYSKAVHIFPGLFTYIEDERPDPLLHKWGRDIAGGDLWEFLEMKERVSQIFPSTARGWNMISLEKARFAPYAKEISGRLKAALIGGKREEFERVVEDFSLKRFLARDFFPLGEMVAEHISGVAADVLNVQRAHSLDLLHKIEEILLSIRVYFPECEARMVEEFERCVKQKVFDDAVAESPRSQDRIADFTAWSIKCVKIPHFGTRALRTWIEKAREEDTWEEFATKLSRRLNSELSVYAETRKARFNLIREAFHSSRDSEIRNLF